MTRTLATLTILLALALAPSLALADGCVHQTVTDGLYGKTKYCTTCCYGGVCNTTCS